jgi:hypothetical protein
VTEIVNLRLARKAKARATHEAQANANRAAFGRTKGEKAATKAESDRRERNLAGAKRKPREDGL